MIGYVLLSQGMSLESQFLLLVFLLLLSVILMMALQKEERDRRKKPYHYCSCDDDPYDWREFRDDLRHAWEHCIIFCLIKFPSLKKIFKKTSSKYFIPENETLWEQIEMNDEYIVFQKKERIPHKKA